MELGDSEVDEIVSLYGLILSAVVGLENLYRCGLKRCVQRARRDVAEPFHLFQSRLKGRARKSLRFH